MNRIHRSAIAFLFLACGSLAAQDADPSLGDVGQVGIGSDAVARKVHALLGVKIAPPGTRGFVPLDPTPILLTAQSEMAISALPPLRSSNPRYMVLRLGKGGRQIAILDQSEPATSRYDLLWIDRDRDQAFSAADEQDPIHGHVVRDPARELDYVEFTAVPIGVYYGVIVNDAGVETRIEESLPFTFYGWHPRSGAVDQLQLISAYWREGNARIAGKDARVVVFDDSASALLGMETMRWTLLELAPDAALPAGLTLSPTSVPLHCYGLPYRMATIDPRGLRVDIAEETEANTALSVLEADPLQVEPPRPRAEQQVEWMTDYAAAEELSKKDGRPICVWYGADWSRLSRQLDERTLQDAEVAKLLSAKFVCVKLNPALDRVIASRHQALLTPTLVFVDKNGQVVDRIVGYRQARDLATTLRRWRN